MVVVNFNGDILDPSDVSIPIENRAFKYGDAVFETVKFSNGNFNFWEDHYFRLMTGMRIIRMDIPMTFSPEYLEDQMRETIAANHTEYNANRVRLTVFRNDGGHYAPQTNAVSFIITTEKIPHQDYVLNQQGLVLDLYKDNYKPTGLLAGIKSANALLYVMAAVHKQENGFDECLLINSNKEVAEAISANVFLVKDDYVQTPPVETGCLKGVMRKNIIKILKENGYQVKEESFSPFELQRANEVFLTNAVHGVQWVERYRKKQFAKNQTTTIIELLNRATS